MSTEREALLAEVASAYQGLEDPAAFPDADALARYRIGLLERTVAQADFLGQRLQRPARVVEAACGNGRLLVELARRGALSEGLGFDIARSRIAFAQQWAADLGLGALTFADEDALRIDLPAGHFDAAICITGSLAYFEPAQRGLAAAVLERLSAALVTGGLLMVELYPHPRERALLGVAGGEARLWRELPDDDPWRFYLSSFALDPETDVLTHTKTFVHRTTGEIDEGRRERILLYTQETITQALIAADLDDVELFEGWTPRPYAGGDVLVATARRR